MKASMLIFLPAVIFFSCKKNNDNRNTSPAILLGKWVNVSQRLDTLDVYLENNRVILFDNSLFFRTIMPIRANRDEFIKEVGSVQNERIYVRPYKSNDVYFDNYFKWLSLHTKFEISVQALHPELSALYNITYEKVQ